MAKVGRPTKYTKELGEKICALIANQPYGLNRLHRDLDWFPERTVVLDWLFTHEEFSTLYAQAKEKQADFLLEECVEIADDGSNDLLGMGKNGAIENREFTSRSKLRVETRLEVMRRLAPKKYGKDMVEHSGQIEYKAPNVDVTISAEVAKKQPTKTKPKK